MFGMEVIFMKPFWLLSWVMSGVMTSKAGWRRDSKEESTTPRHIDGKASKVNTS